MQQDAGQSPSRASGEQYDLTRAAGLSDSEALARLKADGPNELPTAKPRGILAIALEVAREPMFVLLVAAGACIW